MKSSNIQVLPSILSADFAHLERDVKNVEQSGADQIHCDIMDGHFVPNITFGPLVVEAVKRSVSIPLDVHLMISDPAKYIPAFCNAGADTITVHAETVEDLPILLADLKRRGVKTGVAVNPDKPIALFTPYLGMIDQVLIMTVFAGFGGQKFIPDSLAKIVALRAEIDKCGHDVAIEVDGGINPETAAVCALHGATLFVTGNYIFGGADYRERIGSVRSAAQKGADYLLANTLPK